MKLARQLAPRLLVLAVSLVVSLLLAEAIVRVAGHAPWPAERTLDRPPGLHDLDDELGWVPQPGAHEEVGSVTILEDRTRATGPTRPALEPDIVIVGGSFAFGQEVADDETFAWKLQSKLGPEHHVVNLGTPAYGTYQALLRLERFFDSRPAHRRVVVYPFATFHEVRNVAAASWREMLERGNADTLFEIPYCTLDDDGGLVRHPPEPNRPAWPLRHRLALVPFVSERIAQWRGRGRDSIQRDVTLALIREMRDLAHANDAELLVAFVFDRRIDGYRRALRADGITTVDCNDSRILGGSWRVPGSIHPDGRGHTHYAECIAAGLERLDAVQR